MNPGISWLESPANGTDSEVGRVAVAAQVAENHGFEGRGLKICHQLCRIRIRQMAMTRRNPLLHRPRPLCVALKKGIIIVCLHEQPLNIAECLNHQPGGIAEICEDPKSGMLLLNTKSHRIRGIMGHGEGSDLQFLDGKARSGFKKPNPPRNFWCFECSGRESITIEGKLPPLEENLQSPGVIRVFMGEQNTINR